MKNLSNQILINQPLMLLDGEAISWSQFRNIYGLDGDEVSEDKCPIATF